MEELNIGVTFGSSVKETNHDNGKISTLTVLSYNLWNFNKKYHQRMKDVVDFIRDVKPDIISLQEVRLSNW